MKAVCDLGHGDDICKRPSVINVLSGIPPRRAGLQAICTVTRTASQNDAVGGHSKTATFLCGKVSVPDGAELEPAARVGADVHLLRKATRR